MARGSITVTDLARTGITPISQTNSDASNKHLITLNDGKVFLEIISSDAGSQTVVFKSNPDLTTDGLTLSDLTITIAAGATKLVGPFKVATFKQNATNDLYIDPSVSTNLKFRAYRLQPA